jgi:signal recognition particle subunit SRP54
MLEILSSGIEKALKFIKGEGKLTESNLNQALRDVRLSLLQADVNLNVVKDFIERVKQKALGKEVMESFTPYTLFVKIVRDELLELFGKERRNLLFSGKIPTIFMLVGLQGTGKTTTAGKLALYLKENGYSPILASIDMKRPAAQSQLKTIAQFIGIPFYEGREGKLKEIVNELLNYVKDRGFNPLIVDTAGRLHIDEELMEELKEVKDLLQPTETIYIADSMTGQDAVKSAKLFDEKIGITSIILTKLDGDQRGGAALSIVSVTGKPIKFIGIGEKYSDFQPFYPERLVSRILGMGDILSLVEKAEKAIDIKKAEEMEKRLRKEEFTLEDLREQLKMLRKMGSFKDILDHLPAVGPLKNLSEIEIDEKKIVHMIAIIDSMTPKERLYPERIDGKRRLRIARGSGRPVQEVNQLIRQFLEMKKLMKKPGFKKLLNLGNFIKG